MENTITLSAPWVEYFNKLVTMFRYDPEVHITMSEQDKVVQIRVDNQIKANALAKLLPQEKTFGNITMKIQVIHSGEEDQIAMLRNALNGNPVVNDIAVFDTIFGNFACVIFEPIVAQYYNDNMRDPSGITTTLYQELAKELFNTDNEIVYCTADNRSEEDA